MATDASADLASDDEREIIGRAPRALGWSFANTAASRLGTLAIGIVLARLLGPEQFGTFAIALVAQTAAMSLNELGVSLAIVRWAGDVRRIAPTVASISIASSILVFVVIFLTAPSFAHAMGDPTAAGVVRVLGATVIVSGVVATPAMLLQRSFMQRAKTAVDQVSVWSGALTSLALVLSGMGAMSLALGRLVGVLVSSVLFLKFSPLPFRLGLDRTQVRPLLHFGLPLAGASVVVFALSFADQLITGAMLGPTALGFYVLAANLATWPVNMLSKPMRSVAPAVFARLQSSPQEMRQTFGDVLGLLAAVAFPACIVLAAAAVPVVRWVYGDEWAPAAGALRWLAVYAAIRIVFEFVYDYLVIAGNSSVLLRLQILSLLVLLPVLVAGARLAGISGAAAGQAGVALIVLLPMYLYQLRRVGIPPSVLLRRLTWPTALSLGAAVAAALIAVRVGPASLAAVLAGGVACVAMVLVLLLNRGPARALRTLLRTGVPAGEGTQ